MIKRRYYRLEHGSKDAPSESSSSSDSEVEAEARDDSSEEEEEDDEENAVAEVREREDASSSSGYESEDSSVNEVNLDSSGLPTSDDESAPLHDGHNILGNSASGKADTILSKTQGSPEKDAIQFSKADCVLKRKSVFKCRLCPRIVCLSEETLKAHLNSKRHARSEKLLKEGRLKLMLNENGQIEGDDYQPEKNASDTDSEQEESKPKKKGKGRLKHKKRSNQKETGSEKTRRPRENREKRRKKDS